MRDKETGKSRGFAFLKYEDQRSTDLAVDNLGGTVIMNRTLRVDHTRYKKKDDDSDNAAHLITSRPVDTREDLSATDRVADPDNDGEEDRSMLKEERELAILIRDHDDDDPMKGFLVQKKKDEISKALGELKKARKPARQPERRHNHSQRSYRSSGRERPDGRNQHVFRDRRDDNNYKSY